MSDRLDVLIEIRETYENYPKTIKRIDHEIDQLMASELRRSRAEEIAKTYDDILVFQLLECTDHAMSPTEISEITGFTTQKTSAITRRLYAWGLLEREAR